jgi:hypothetical protein
VVKGKSSLIFSVAANCALAPLSLNEQTPSAPPALLLSEIVLVLVIRPGILAGERTKFRLPSSKFRLTNYASFLHMIFKVGCKCIT